MFRDIRNCGTHKLACIALLSTHLHELRCGLRSAQGGSGPGRRSSLPVDREGRPRVLDRDAQWDARTLAEKLDYLFRTVHPPSRREYSSEEVAEDIRARGGPTISAT